MWIFVWSKFNPEEENLIGGQWAIDCINFENNQMKSIIIWNKMYELEKYIWIYYFSSLIIILLLMNILYWAINKKIIWCNEINIFRPQVQFEEKFLSLYVLISKNNLYKYRFCKWIEITIIMISLVASQRTQLIYTYEISLCNKLKKLFSQK